MDAKQIGFDACKNGVTRNKNPFSWEKEFKKWYAWDVGWETAKYV